ncbi:MAG: RagB/SusD family nutrient uptake outer membrane protein [Flavisolibacter sp.]
MKNIVFLLAAILSLSSCKKFLDRQPTTDYTTAGFYNGEANIRYGVNGVYQSIYWEVPYSLPQYVLFDHYTPLGVNPDNGTVLMMWSMAYQTIARCHSVLDGAKPFFDKLNPNAKQYLAETKVIRAWAYYYLVNLYGDVPFFTGALTPDQFQSPKTSRDKIIDFLLIDLDSASAYLPWIAKERGRVDKTVCYGLKSRIALNAGSLNINSKGPDYFKLARDAAKQVMDNSGRSLNPKYDDLFTRLGQLPNAGKEIMFELMYSDQGVTRSHYISFGQVSRNYGQCGRFPTQLLADTYECTDGKRMDESPLYNPKTPFNNRDPRLRATIWMQGDTVIGNSGSRLKFIMDIYRSTTPFYDYTKGTWTKKNNADINSAAAWTSPANNGVGYLWKKYCNFDDENVAKPTYNLVLMRYAEILLTYAESKIELNELDNTVYAAINQVRNRVGMPNVGTERMGNQTKMRQLVRRERKVELAFEGLHLFDMRRWKTGALENNSPTYGYPLATVANNVITAGGYENATADMVPNFKKTQEADLNDVPDYSTYAAKLKKRDANRFWDNKFYLWPIPQGEKDKNQSLTQNPGY